MSATSLQSIYNLTAKLNRLKENTNNFKNNMDGKPQEYVNLAVQQFASFVSDSLNEVRDTIVDFARSQYCACLKIIEPLEPLVNLLENILDLSSVINAVKAVIGYLIGPYYKAITAQAELIVAVTQLSVALISTVATIVEDLAQISPTPVNIQIDPITLSEITTCPVDKPVVEYFKDFPTLN